jgi:hypothetical protein
MASRASTTAPRASRRRKWCQKRVSDLEFRLRGAEPLLGDLEALLAVLVELDELALALLVFLLALELAAELLELLAAGTPQRPQRVVRQSAKGKLGRAEQRLERLKFGGEPRRGAFLLLQPLAQLLQLRIEAGEFLLELGAVPVQLEEALLLGRVPAPAEARQPQPRQLVAYVHGRGICRAATARAPLRRPSGRSGGRARRSTRATCSA